MREAGGDAATTMGATAGDSEGQQGTPTPDRHSQATLFACMLDQTGWSREGERNGGVGGVRR